MTDLEMTKLCAAAMGYKEWVRKEGQPIDDCANYPSAIRIEVGRGGSSFHMSRNYDPLKDDAQAFALLTTFNFVTEREKGNVLHAATLFGHYKANAYISRAQASLNRAIVECVAHMQKAKSGASA